MSRVDDHVAGTVGKPDLVSLQAEARWLKTHFEQRLSRAHAEIASLRSQPAEPAAVAVEGDLDPELRGLRAEVHRMREAERRYLDRIEELKEEATAARVKAAGEGGR